MLQIVTNEAKEKEWSMEGTKVSSHMMQVAVVGKNAGLRTKR